MYKTSNCPLCGGYRYENEYGVHCNTNHCPCGASYPDENSIVWGWNHDPKYMEEHEKYYIERWNLMGKNYVKWLKDNGKPRKAHDNIADEVIIKDGSSITLENGTKITFKRGEGQSKYTGIMEVNGEGADAEEVHFWLETDKGIIYDGSDYKRDGTCVKPEPPADRLVREDAQPERPEWPTNPELIEESEVSPSPPSPPSPPPKRIRKGVS